ncbi:restriction endonuclease subunit S [Phocaeicola plebeius]|uniref:restriction endonuclease subunit S n=1 Tax=Phocaeicola plebeius TaxID=310297 RepID=UPI0026E932D6|nr:restriction endonuclease subunit S [Phocaeicola plebeius]
MRFPEFTDKWEAGKLEEYILLVSGQDLSSEQYTDKEDVYPYITGASSLNSEGIILNRWTHTPTQIVKRGDILLVCKGSGVGQLTVLSNVDKAHIARQIMGIRAKNTESQLFIYHYLSRLMTELKKRSTGIIPGIDRKSILSLHISIPSLQEQQKVAELLSLIEQRIITQNKIIEKYESLIQAICDTLIESGQPKVELSFNDFGEPYSGLSGKSAEDFGKGWPYITYMNVYQNQIIDITDVGLVKINETEQQSVVRYGDILFTLSSETPDEVGMGAVYLGDIYPLYLNSFCFGVHITDESKIYPPFLAYYISTKSFRKAVFPLAQGSTRFNLQKSDFMKKKFLFPTVEEQNKIYSVLKAYSDKLSIEKNIANLLCEQKSYLLRQLFI